MKPKILFILHYPPPVHGAAMVGKFIKESKLINSSFETKHLRLGTTNSFQERKKTTIKKIFRFLKLWLQCLIASLSFKPNLVYLSLTSKGVGFYKDVLIILIFKITGQKLIYHFHNKGIRVKQDHLFDNLLYQLVFYNARVILLSRFLYSDIQKYIPEEKIFYVPNGIPVMPQNKFIRPSKTNEPVQILFLSNLLETKGVFILLEACKKLKEKKINFHCSFVGGEGDINAEQFQKKVNSLGLTNEVHYLGKKYDREKEDVFLDADIFAFPTHYPFECFPLVLLEAMQFSLPVISTYEGGIPDIVEDEKTGFLIQQNNITALAQKLETLIQQPKLRKVMGTAGREKFLREFTLAKFEKRMNSILEQTAFNNE